MRGPDAWQPSEIVALGRGAYSLGHSAVSTLGCRSFGRPYCDNAPRSAKAILPSTIASPSDSLIASLIHRSWIVTRLDRETTERDQPRSRERNLNSVRPRPP